MLRTLILASTLAMSGLAHAHGYAYHAGRVVTVEPTFTISFGQRYPDGYRILYEVGGHRYWTHSYHRPGHTIVVPARPVTHVYHHYHYGKPGWHPRHDDRRHWRHDRRDGPPHGRHHSRH